MGRDLARALARLARAQRESADALEALATAAAEPTGDPAELVPHSRWPFSRRVACRLARTGAIKAKRSGKSWIATRGELDRYLASLPTPTTPTRTGAEVVDLDTIRREFAARGAR